MSAEPPKYEIVDGMSRVSPAWKAWKNGTGQPTTAPPAAAPVVSTLGDHADLNETRNAAGLNSIPLAPSVQSTVEDFYQDPDIASKLGMTSGNVIDILGKMMAKYEIPLGMLNTLTALVQYWVRMLIDDSRSMGNDTDTLRPDGSGRHYTRWEEAKIRLMELVEILAHIPSLGIEIRGLNRSDVIRIPREGGLTPEEFVRVVSAEVDRFFATPPDGSTPIMKALKKLDQQDHEIVYLFSDGVPDGGPDEVNEICKYLKKRKNPQLRPIVLFACTNEDESVAWMEEVEEEAGYCAAYDDFEDEKSEILRDQGDRLPYTKGFYLVCALVGALFPNTLDALDDSGPIPRKIMSNMFGYEVTPEEYRLYFERFREAQAARARAAGATADPTTTFKNTFDWTPAFEELMATDKPLDGTVLGKKYHKRLHSA